MPALQSYSPGWVSAAFALAGQLAFALGAFFVMTTARGPRVPLERIWMNAHLDSGVRAIVFSLRGQASALSQIVGGPIFGAVATASTTRPALLGAAAIFAPALLLYARIQRRDPPPSGKADVHRDFQTLARLHQSRN